jgi:hypothetical protein
MAKLVIGANKTNGVPAIVKEVSTPPVLGTKTITTNGTYNASSDNYDGYSSVTVSVPGPSGTKYISDNGSYNVTNFSIVDVQVYPDPYVKLVKNISGAEVILRNSTTESRMIYLSNVTKIEDYVLARSYYENQSVTTVPDFSSVTKIGYKACNGMFFRATNLAGTVDLSSLSAAAEGCCSSMFMDTKITSITIGISQVRTSSAFSQMCSGCSYLTSFSLQNLTSVEGTQSCNGMFNDCTALTTADLSSLVYITGSNGCSYMFSGCTALASADLSSLQSIASYGCRGMFFGCTSLTSVSSFSALSDLSREACEEMFKNSGVTTLSFPALKSTSFGSRTDQFHDMLSGVTGCTVHFPSNLQAVIGSWADVTAGFGGTNTTILYDLPQTE